jgi:hypothetical protein
MVSVSVSYVLELDGAITLPSLGCRRVLAECVSYFNASGGAYGGVAR